MDVESLEQRLVALEQLLERVQEQALAEPPRPRQEVVLALGDQPFDEGSLVDVVAVLLPHLAEGLDADRQPALGHKPIIPSRGSSVRLLERPRLRRRGTLHHKPAAGGRAGQGLDYQETHTLQSIRMTVHVSTTWAARNLGDCLARIKHTGDQFVLLKNGRPMAELVPVAGSRATLREVWDALSSVPVDADFADDLQAVNSADQALESPWDSSSIPRP